MPGYDLEAHLQRGLLWTPALAAPAPTPHATVTTLLQAPSLPPPPIGLWNWWPRWLTVGRLSSGRHVASSCAHRMWETSLAQRGRASPHHPVCPCKTGVRGKWVWKENQPAVLRKAECPKASNLLPLKCHLCYHSISWKGQFSSLCCSWQSWPRTQSRVNISHSS